MKRNSVLNVTIIFSLLLIAARTPGALVSDFGSAAGVRVAGRVQQRVTTDVLADPNTLPTGSHDESSGQQNQFSCLAEGWATDPDDQSILLNVRVLSDGVEVAQATAGTFRQDLLDADVCPGGNCSFSVNLWGLITPGVDHSITEQAQDAQTGEWVDLPSTPKTLNCSEANLEPEGSHDGLSGLQNQYSCFVYGWAVDPNDRDVDLSVRILSDGVEVTQSTASIIREDLETCPGGTCGFAIDLWGLVSPDADHSISAQAQDAQTGEWVDLSNTPQTLNCAEPHAQTFVVNSTADSGDTNQGNGVCETSNTGECTLRAAIEEANANAGLDTVNFSIPGAGPYTISPSYGFDFVFDPVVIDGTTQPGFAGTPIIELDGSGAGPDAYGVVIFAGSSTVRGLVINRFALTGLDLDVNGGNTIQGNYIGTDITGTLDLGNGVNGIAISQGSAGNLIGGTAAGEGNLISGNGGQGIVVVDAGSAENLIQGNYVGTDITGTLDIGNDFDGVAIAGGASDNVIGGAVASGGNLISGNDGNGVGVYDPGTTGNLVQGNHIGTDATGTSSLGNTFDGVVMVASNNTIGGTTPTARNIISGNGEQGVRIQGPEASGNTVQGNFIGTDATGGYVISNGTSNCCHSGVVLHLGAANNTIGGTVPGAGNVISGNTFDGVTITDPGTTGNLVQGNFIGTDVTGTLDLGNAVDGVSIFQAAGNTIGGTGAGAGNLISGNEFNGVDVYDAGANGNAVQGNLIGTDVTGSTGLGNASAGVVIMNTASGNLVGGSTAGAGNVIAFNGANGVILTEDAGAGNTISSNSIYSNARLGIDLGDEGVTPNDHLDADGGPNGLQNFAVINLAETSGATTTVQGRFAGARDTTVRLEFFSSEACDASGFGEGKTFLGFMDVTTNHGGGVNFALTFGVSLPLGSFMTVTATDPAGSTSEFSECEVVGSDQ